MTEFEIEKILKKKTKVLSLVKKFSTPFYIFDKPELKASIKDFQKAFTSRIPRTKIFYAMKSNPYAGLIKEVVKNGLGIDASSGRELKLALKAKPKTILFTGPGKTDDELELALKHQKIVTLNIDSWSEFNRLNKLVTKQKKKIKIGIRINNKHHGSWNKFGVSLTELPKLWNLVSQSSNVVPVGIQIHTSWNEDAEPYERSISEIGSFLNRDKSIYNSLRFIDLGGGFLTREMNGISLEEYAKGIRNAISRYIKRKNLDFFFEPGRLISYRSMQIVLKVVDLKAKGAVITDGGTNMFGWVDKEDPFPAIVNLSNPSRKRISVKVFGSLCTPEDIWGDKVYGKGIKEGDILILPHQGAYTYTYAQAFIKEFPRVYRL